MVAIKICGVRDASIAAQVADLADYIGVVSYSPSPRHVELARMRDVLSAVSGGCRSVVLMVEPSDKQLDEVFSVVRPDAIQLYGAQSVERCNTLGQRYNCGIIKALGVKDKADIHRAREFAVACEWVLLDAAAAAGQLPGGRGVSFDWQLLGGEGALEGFMLAGGLSASNVAQAIRYSGVGAVDVSSGVEVAAGVKSMSLVRDFVAAARASLVNP